MFRSLLHFHPLQRTLNRGAGLVFPGTFTARHVHGRTSTSTTWQRSFSCPAQSVAYISLGSNFGGTQRIRILENALLRIRREVGLIDACSCLYETLPGYDVDSREKAEHDMYMPLHLNAVVRVQTSFSDPRDVLRALHNIEAEHHRDRLSTALRLHRTLDLDLLFFYDEQSQSFTLNTARLTLPHPRLCQRNFVLFPLCDIAPDLVHPTEGVSVRNLVALNLERRRDVLQNSFTNGGEGIPMYTLDGNLAVPRRCFAPSDQVLWTVKRSGPAVSDTLRWIKEVLQRHSFDKQRGKACDASFLQSLLALKEFLENEPKTPRIMGVLNVTPDSFSDGNMYLASVDTAVEHARTMVREGAAVIDVGGEATNPFVKEDVSADTETKRIVPVIKAIRKKAGTQTMISVDTRRRTVAEAALALGIDIVGLFNNSMATSRANAYALACHIDLGLIMP